MYWVLFLLQLLFPPIGGVHDSVDMRKEAGEAAADGNGATAFFN